MDTFHLGNVSSQYELYNPEYVLYIWFYTKRKIIYEYQEKNYSFLIEKWEMEIGTVSHFDTLKKHKWVNKELY